MRGLALEGGGAKGAYQAGAIKALNQRKIFFDGVAGTSIGAINAALYACGNFEGLYHLWPEMDSKYIFGIDGKILNDISNKKFKLDDIKEGIGSISKIIKNLGVDNKNVKKLLEKNISEDKLRKSKICPLMTKKAFSSENFLDDELFSKYVSYIESLFSIRYLPKFSPVLRHSY